MRVRTVLITAAAVQTKTREKFRYYSQLKENGEKEGSVVKFSWFKKSLKKFME